jgi:hypothetical protein
MSYANDMSYFNQRNFIAAITGCLLSLSWAHAASVSVTPSASSGAEGGTADLNIVMDFSAPESTVGGGIDLTFGGGISFNSFAADAFLATLDSDFTGFGQTDANNPGGFEIHLGDFSGFFGQNTLGVLTVNLDSLGAGTIVMAINNAFGPFFSSIDPFDELVVDLNGADVDVTAVPVPAAVWMFGSALGLLGFVRRRLHKA